MFRVCHVSAPRPPPPLDALDPFSRGAYILGNQLFARKCLRHIHHQLVSYKTWYLIIGCSNTVGKNHKTTYTLNPQIVILCSARKGTADIEICRLFRCPGVWCFALRPMCKRFPCWHRARFCCPKLRKLYLRALDGATEAVQQLCADMQI